VTGEGFAAEEMVDQVAIFFLAGHETSAAALGWALYLLATHPEVRRRGRRPRPWPSRRRRDFGGLARLRFTRDVFREALGSIRRCR
jgi:cytochrome P450